jgi:hypothetical protein
VNNHYFTHPKWLVHFFNLVDRIPIPKWVLGGLVIVASGVVHHLIAWRDGFLTRGSFDLYLATVGIYFVLYFYFWDLLSKRAKRDLEIFFSHSKKSRQSIDREIDDFNSLSETTSLLVILFGLPGSILLFNQVISSLTPMTQVIPWIGTMAFSFLGTVSGLAFARLIRQAYLMRKMYAEIEVDVFKPFRIYDLSSYGSFSAASLILLFYTSSLMGFSGYLFLLPGIINQITIFAVAALLFVFPLMGINQRMKQAKEDLLIQTGENIRMVYEQINSAAKKKDFRKLDKVRGALSTLRETKEIVDQIPTWPWQSSALGNFIFPLLIPIIAFLIQLFIEIRFGL